MFLFLFAGASAVIQATNTSYVYLTEDDYGTVDLFHSLFPKAHSQTMKNGTTSIESPSSTICGAEQLLKEGKTSLEFGTLCDSVGTSDSESVKKGNIEMRWGFVNVAANPFSEIPNPPSIVGVTAADPLGNAGYTKHDTITINFNKPTNRPDASDKPDIQKLLEFRDFATKKKVSIGKDFVGSWISPSKLKITILDPANADGALTDDPHHFFVAVKKEGNLRDQTQKSPPSTATSAKAKGSFDTKALLSVAALKAKDPGETDSSYSDGDTISVVFSDSTNTPDVSSTSKINNLFEYRQGGQSFSSIGSKLSGKWIDSGLTLLITVKDTDGADRIPEVGKFKVKLNSGTKLESEDGIPVDSVSDSPFLEGSFGQENGPQIVSFVASDPAGETPNSYGSGDILTIKFEGPTNQPEVDSKSKLNNLLRFFQSNQNLTLGGGFTGRWLDPLRLEIKITNATVDDQGNKPTPLPQVGKLQVQVKQKGGLQDEDKESKNSTSKSGALSGTFEASEGPSIIRVLADDPDGGSDKSYSDGDTITIRFSEHTNLLPVSSKGDIEKFLDFVRQSDGTSLDLGDKFSGEWTKPDTLVITIKDSNGATPPSPEQGDADRLVVDPKTFKENGETRGIRNSEETSKFTDDKSQPMTGSFGAISGPLIDALVADDPDDSDSVFSSGDTITVRFGQSTNEADPTPSEEGLSKSDLEEMFVFSQSIGPRFSGEWINARTLVITVDAATPLSPPEPGQFNVVALADGNIRDDETESEPSTDKSPPLLGDFGTFSKEKPVEKGATATTNLPAGTISQTTLPSGQSGSVTISRTQASNVLNGGKQAADFVGDVADINVGTGASCSGTCTMSFLFSEDDAKQAGVDDPFDVKIMHDQNDDGDFDDKGEVLDTTVVQFSPGIFKASASADKTSKFAIGGVRALDVAAASTGGGGNDFVPPRITSEQIESPGGRIFGARLDLTEDQPAAVNTFETGEVVNVAVSLSENMGIFNLQHVALYTNIRGEFGNDPSDSDTWIVWEKGQPVKVHDRNGFWNMNSLQEGTNDRTAAKNANVTISAQKLGSVELSSVSGKILTNNEIQDKKSATVKDTRVVFSVVFNKPMETSDIVIRAWDSNRNFEEQRYKNVWQIIDASPQKQQQELFQNKEGVPEEEQQQKKKDEKTKKEIVIPTWIKNNAGWWHEEQVSDTEFARAIEYLIENDVIEVSATQLESEKNTSVSGQKIPSWVRNVAGWWSEDNVSDKEFVRSIGYLVDRGVIRVGE